jgi:hypothetical protein
VSVFVQETPVNLPFSEDQFFGVLSAYNNAIWPLQCVLLLLAFGIVAAALKDTPLRGVVISSLLSLLWVWMAVAYHWKFFSTIQPYGIFLTGLFGLQAALLFWFGHRPRNGLRFNPRGDLPGFTGAFLVAYALVLHPSLSMWTGRTYPALATFGLPCPTTIFTIVVLLWARPRAHGSLMVVPAVWSVLCLPTTLSLRLIEDSMLLLSVVVAGGIAILQNRRTPPKDARVLGPAGAARSRPVVHR